MKAGVTIEQAQAEMATIASRLEQEHREKNAGRGLNLVPLHEALTGNLRRALLVLLAAVVGRHRSRALARAARRRGAVAEELPPLA